MEIEEIEVPSSPDKELPKKGRRGDSAASSRSTSSASPPPSPKRPPPHTLKGSGAPPNYIHTHGVNGDDNEAERENSYLHPPSDPPSPASPTTSNNKSSPLSGLSTPKMPNIKIKKQYSKIYRIKTKILQNLGKADKTTDEVFDDYESNFNKQQLNANRLHKEISNYLRCARALHGASKALFDTLAEVYEPEWVGHDLIYVQAQNADMLWTDFCHKVQDQTLAPLTVYTQEFPEIRKKIDKRGRKLVDYDSQRHQLENLQRSTRRDEYKIARVKDQLENARSTYETLNKELYDELPSIYDQRIPNTSNSLHTLFAAEGTFMQEFSKISKELEAIAEKLSKECNKGTYNTKRGVPPKAPRPVSVSGESPQSPRSQNSPTVWYEVMDGDAPSPQSPETREVRSQDLEVANSEGPEKIGEDQPKIKKQLEDEEEEFEEVLNNDEDDAPSPPASSPSGTPPPPPPTVPQTSPPDSPFEPSSTSETPSQIPRKIKDENRPTISGPVTPGKEETGRPYEEIEFEDKKVNGSPKVNGEVIGTPIPPGSKNKVEEIYDIPVGATTEGLPPGVLYRVRATYKYVREDVDELGFEVGETIKVVEYEDPEEQEEGWLCGIKESSNEKGLFPANFTRPI